MSHLPGNNVAATVRSESSVQNPTPGKPTQVEGDTELSHARAHCILSMPACPLTAAAQAAPMKTERCMGLLLAWRPGTLKKVWGKHRMVEFKVPREPIIPS